MDNLVKIVGVTGLLVIIFALILVGPIFSIISLNTLFALGIPLNFWTWLSMLWVGLVLFPKTQKSK